MQLEIAKLSKRLGHSWALKDVSLTVAGGTIFGICGRSGSGKSALLSSISEARDGTVRITGDDNVKPVLISGSQRGGWLSSLKGAAPVSDGERQLEAFSASLSKAGRIILLDEPFSHLDPALRSECINDLRTLTREKGLIVVFASSDFDQVSMVADEIAILDCGEVIQSGTAREIYETPASMAAARISGLTNLIQARRITSTDADLPEFYTLEGGHRLFAQQTSKSRLGAINQNATLAIRPEQISMSMGASFPEDNLLRAVVSDIRFTGSTAIIDFDASGLRLKARVFKIVGLNIGDECMLGLPPDRLIVLKD